MPLDYPEFKRQVEEVKGLILLLLEDDIEGQTQMALLGNVNGKLEYEMTMPVLQAAYEELYKAGAVYPELDPMKPNSQKLRRTPESYSAGSANV